MTIDKASGSLFLKHLKDDFPVVNVVKSQGRWRIWNKIIPCPPPLYKIHDHPSLKNAMDKILVERWRIMLKNSSWVICNFASHPSFLVANHTSVDLGTPSQITASNLLLLQDGVQSLPLWMVIMSNAGVKYPHLYLYELKVIPSDKV